MNKLIEKLMTQASTIRYSGMGDTEILDMEKFAQLIVEECLSIIENSRRPINSSICLVDSTKGKIKNHFGF